MTSAAFTEKWNRSIQPSVNASQQKPVPKQWEWKSLDQQHRLLQASPGQPPACWWSRNDGTAAKINTPHLNHLVTVSTSISACEGTFLFLPLPAVVSRLSAPGPSCRELRCTSIYLENLLLLLPLQLKFLFHTVLVRLCPFGCASSASSLLDRESGSLFAGVARVSPLCSWSLVQPPHHRAVRLSRRHEDRRRLIYVCILPITSDPIS